MEFAQNLIAYYKGERLEAILLTILGIFLICIASFMWQYQSQDQLAKGLFFSIAFLAIFTFFVGCFGVYNNSQRLIQLPLKYAENPKRFVQYEIDRFDGKNGVNKWWIPLKITWAILTIAGIALSFWTKKDLINGIAIGLILIGAMGFIIDGFAHQRAKIYTAVLNKQVKKN